MSVAQADGEARMALEDVAYLILDDPRITLTGALVAACMEAGIAIITTDSRHTPSGLTLPFHRHHRQAGIAMCQIEASAPMRKRMWQAIVRAKIENQAAHLAEYGHPNAAALRAMIALVGSGDPANVEARAAREYWKSLFDGFTRENPFDLRNKALNYGYAVIRACIARALVACGLIPSIGLHHASQVNGFNLADDLFEPFRPLVDRAVARLAAGRDLRGELAKEDRQLLAGLPLGELELSGEVMTLLAATERCAESLARAFKSGDAKALLLPALPSAGALASGVAK